MNKLALIWPLIDVNISDQLLQFQKTATTIFRHG